MIYFKVLSDEKIDKFAAAKGELWKQAQAIYRTPSAASSSVLAPPTPTLPLHPPALGPTQRKKASKSAL